MLTRHCCKNRQLHPWPSREFCPASFGQKPGCDTTFKDRGGKLDEKSANVKKRKKIHTIKGSRNIYSTARKAGLVQSNPEAVP